MTGSDHESDEIQSLTGSSAGTDDEVTIRLPGAARGRDHPRGQAYQAF